MTVTDNTPPEILLEAACVFGGYPNVPIADAFRNLAKMIREATGRDEVSPTTIWILGRRTFGKSYKLQ